MSYCRWSSDDFKSDVYCYEGANGFVIMVAENKHIFTEPLPPKVEFDVDNLDEYFARDSLVMDIVRRAETVPINLPHAGESFTCASPQETADKLLELREIGYHVPQYAIDRLSSEVDE